MPTPTPTMKVSSRDIRRNALQALYQFDAGRADQPELVRDSLAGSPGTDEAHDRGFELAQQVWAQHALADAAVASLAPEWPTYRQPVVDRNILRLAIYEMRSGHAPPKVAINEAVELAREYSTEKSPMFINAVLDKIFRAMRDGTAAAPPADAATGEPTIESSEQAAREQVRTAAERDETSDAPAPPHDVDEGRA